MKFSAADTFGSLYNFEQTERLRHDKETHDDYRLPNSEAQISCWKANSASASHEVPLILFRPKVHYRVVPIMTQMN